MKSNLWWRALGALLIASACAGRRAQAQDELRVWKNQQGREIKASLVSVNGGEVLLKLESGTISKVPLVALSMPDQTFAIQSARPAAMSATTARPPVPVGGLTWPATVTINPKALEITVGTQNAAKREYEYNSGSFRYISKAPLSGTVVKEVAADFELAQQFMVQLPWGWLPQPRDGAAFKVYLTETLQDFIDLGGTDTSAAGSKDDYVFIKFTTLGLKKVGPRYAFDLRERTEGEVMGMTMRLLIDDMRGLMQAWSALGLEQFTRKVAYHKGTLKLSKLETSLKAAIAEEKRAKPDAKRMMAYFHLPKKDTRGDVQQIRVENYFDAMLLFYFFGYLDGDGKGTRLHEYYRAIAQESLGWRAFRESNGKTPRPRSTGTYPEWADELMKILVADRTDDQLRAEIVAKFKAIGVKIE